ncbi:MAG: preprotein translocase subunit YajC [Actinomycetia bacterium]|nr:preprotein translocase subunit YajC [Actinomycetes bacterium]
MSALPILVIGVLLVGVMMLSQRNRQRAAAQAEQRRKAIDVGTDVMTTSGLYGTVVEVNDDETVQLSIAPGVEVRWALAAVRDVASLPNQARASAEDDSAEDEADDALDPLDEPPDERH